MKRLPSSLYIWLLLCFATIFCEGLFAQGPKPVPGPKPQLSYVTITIVSVNPAQLLVGEKAAVTYSLSLAGISPKQTTGFVGGSLQGYDLQQLNVGNAPLVALQPKTPVAGTLVIPSSNLGPGDLVVDFYPPPPAGCTGTIANVIRCRIEPIATADMKLNVVEPTVVVRIAGTAYANISKPDSGDSATSNNGYQCLRHDPGCGWWGNSGTDKYFSQNALPAGATLLGTPAFTPYWPLGIDSGNQGAWTWLNSSGSYYAHIDASDQAHPSVKWNNTCWGPFSGKDLYYSISFLVSMPKGTNLGEPTFEPTSQLSSPCLPAGYSATPVGAPPITPTPLTLGLMRTDNYFSGIFGSNSSGTIQTIANGEDFKIVLLKSSNFPGGCGGSGNLQLNPHQVIAGSQLTSLYGSAKVSYPLTIEACLEDTTLAATRQFVDVVITYVPSTP
jgi:hypothetical protein